MKQNKIFLIIILTITMMLTGCWDSKELDELMIPFLGSIDLVEPYEKEYPDDRYLVGVSYPTFYEEIQKNNNYAAAAGYLIGETRSRRNAHIGEQLVTGQTKVLLIGNKLAEQGSIDELLDILTRDPSTKASLYLAIVDGRAIDILKARVNHYPDPDEYIRKLLKHVNKTNFYPYISLFHYNREVFSNNISPLIPYIIYKNGDIVLAGSCFVNNGKKVAHLGREETETAVLLRGIKCRGTLSFPVKKDDKIIDGLSLACSNSRKVKVKNEGDHYSIDITIKLKGGIVERSKQVAFEDSKEVITLGEKSLEDIIQKKAEALIKKTQNEIKCDTLGVANYLRAITRWKLDKADIDEIIQNADIKVNVDVTILSTEGKL